MPDGIDEAEDPAMVAAEEALRKEFHLDEPLPVSEAASAPSPLPAASAPTTTPVPGEDPDLVVFDPSDPRDAIPVRGSIAWREFLEDIGWGLSEDPSATPDHIIDMFVVLVAAYEKMLPGSHLTVVSLESSSHAMVGVTTNNGTKQLTRQDVQMLTEFQSKFHPDVPTASAIQALRAAYERITA